MNLLRSLAAAALLAAGPAWSAESLAVIGAGDPPSGPDADLAELTHQLRAACRDRAGNVVDVPTMRAKLLGQLSNATLGELDRAYGGALAVYQNGEFDSSIRTLRAIVDDLEGLPESEEGYVQWRRALLRLAHASATVGRDAEADAALVKILRVEPTFRPDTDQYSPAYRRHFDDLRATVKAMPARKLVVTSEGKPGTVFVNGRPMGSTPLTLKLPAGQYRVGGAVGSLHVPSFGVDLQDEDRAIVLDFALAASLRVNAGPGLALAPVARAYGIIRAGAWLGVDKLVVASRVIEGDAHFLLGGLYDVRRGALLREGSVRMVAGAVPSLNLGALAAFLLTGQGSREVKHRSETPREIPLAFPTRPLEAAGAPSSELAPPAQPGFTATTAVTAAPRPAPPVSAEASTQERVGRTAPPVAAGGAPAASPAVALVAAAPVPAALKPGAPVEAAPAVASLAFPAPRDAPRAELSPRSWKRSAMWVSGGLALGFAGLATQQGLASASAGSDADAMLGSGGVLRPGSDPGRYRDLRDRADSSSRNAYLSAGAAAVFAATAGVLGWSSWQRDPGPPAVRF
jgi:hypothetical protein